MLCSLVCAVVNNLIERTYLGIHKYKHDTDRDVYLPISRRANLFFKQ